MYQETTRLLIDEARFASDPLDGETIIMDLVGGRLFLLEQAASLVWESLRKGETRDEIAISMRQHYGQESLAAFELFVNRLIALGLVTVSEVNVDADVSVGTGESKSASQWPEALGEFKLTEYDDMTSIITMDPIHDVDPDRGWPHDRTQ